MSYIIKILFYLFRELIFDNKEESDIRSKNFNPRKFIILILITASFALNFWMSYRFVVIANELIRCREADLPTTSEPFDKTTGKPPAEKSGS